MNNLTSTSESFISPVWTRYTPIVAERAEGATVYDRDGTCYLDFIGGHYVCA